MVLPNAVGEEFLTGTTVTERDNTIVMVGRLDANKNVMLLLKCFAELKKEHVTDGWRVLVYGDGEDREVLEGKTQALGIADSVSFMGRQRDIADRIRNAGIYCLLSDREGMPNALIEAMCLGLPCITTDCVTGGIGQIVKDGENALVIPVGDGSALASALKSLIQDPSLADRIGSNAKALKEQYRLGRVVDRWEELLAGVIGKKRGDIGS